MDYTTHYVFELKLEGEKALKEAEALRERLKKALDIPIQGDPLQSLIDKLQSLKAITAEATKPTQAYTTALRSISTATKSGVTESERLARNIQRVGQAAEYSGKALQKMRAPSQAVGSSDWAAVAGISAEEWSGWLQSQALPERGEQLQAAQSARKAISDDAELRTAYQQHLELQRSAAIVTQEKAEALMKQRVALLNVLKQVEQQRAEMTAAETRTMQMEQEAQRKAKLAMEAASPLQAARNALEEIKIQDEIAREQGPSTLQGVAAEAFMYGVDKVQRELWGFRRMAYDMQHIGTMLATTGAAVTGAMALTSKQYMSFDKAATSASIAMRLQADLQGDLRDSIIDTSVAMGAFSPAEIAEGLRLWADDTGEVVTSTEQLNRLLGDTIEIQKLAALHNADLGTIMGHTTAIMHTFGLGAKDVAEITEVMNFVATDSFARLEDMGESFKMVGPLAASLGITFTEAASALSLLSDVNLRGSQAGRGLGRMFEQLLKPTDKYNRAMNEITGTTRGTTEAWKAIVFPGGEFMGLPEYIEMLADSTAHLTEQQRMEKLAALSTATSLRTLTPLVQQQIEARAYGVNVLSAYEKVMLGVTDSETQAYKRMYEAQTGLPFSLEGAHARMTDSWNEFAKQDSVRMQRMTRQWEAVILRIGEAFTAVLLPDLERVVKALDKITKALKGDTVWANWIKNIGIASFVTGGLIKFLGQLGQALVTAQAIATGIKIATGVTAAAGAATAGAAFAEASAAAVAGGAGAGAASLSGIIAAAITALGGPAIIAGLVVAALIGAGAIAIHAASKGQRETTAAARAGLSEDALSEFDKLYGRNLLTGTIGYVSSRGGLEKTGENLDKAIKHLDAAGVNISETTRIMRDSNKEMLAAAKGLSGIPKLLSDVSVFMAQRFETLLVGRLVADNVEGVAAAVAEGMRQFPTPTPQSMWWLGGLTPVTEATLSAPLQKGFTDEEIGRATAYYQYTQQRVRIETDYRNQRQKLAESYGASEAKAARNLQKQLADLANNFDKENLRRQEDFAQRMAKAAQDNAKQAEQAQRQHLDSLRKAQLSHRDRMIDLLEARDVQGITKEMRRYKRETAEAKEAFAEQQRDRQADYAERMREEEENYARENARRQEDYDERRAQMRQAYEEERAERAAQFAKSQAELERNRQQQLQQLADAFYESIVGLETLLGDEYRRLLRELDKFLQEYTGLWRTLPEAIERALQEAMGYRYDPYVGVRIPSDLGQHKMRAAGGYADDGVYRLGERGREFVLSAETTKAMESRFGYLSQSTFNHSSGDSFVFAPVFHGMGAQDRSWYLQAAKDVFYQEIGQVTRRVR